MTFSTPPRGLTIDNTGYSLDIRYRWFSFETLFLTFFILFWDIGLIAWYKIALVEGEWIMMLFPLIHVVVGILLTIRVLAGWFNRTRIEAEASKITITTFPFSLRPKRTLESWTIQQLSVRRDQLGLLTFGPGNNKIEALLTSQKRVALVRGLKRDRAKAIEQALEKYLSISDREI